MDLTYPAEAEPFRKEIRAWLEDNLPAGWFDDGFEMSDEDAGHVQRRVAGQAVRAAAGSAPPGPRSTAARVCRRWRASSLAEEFARAKAPMRADFFGDTLVGPTMLQWGTEEQKREFLPKILKGEMRWCQGFSEPNSGSDLASLKTTAVLDGDEWVINGQKVWTTRGHHADYCFLLTRTDPDAPKHKGISYLLVPMHQPGVEVRGITQPDGTAEFCEVFFTDARCPKDNVVGGVNNGWKVANSTLGFERGQSATTGYRRFEEEYRQMVAAATENGAIDDPPDPPAPRSVLHEVSRSCASTACARCRATLTGTKDLGVAALGAMNKMFWSEMHQRAMELALDIYGAESMLVDAGPASRLVAGRAARQAPRGLPGQPDDVVVLLLPLRDDLGRHQPDPAQHRRRARARPPQGTAQRLTRSGSPRSLRRLRSPAGVPLRPGPRAFHPYVTQARLQSAAT